jgi:hypothetical protein
MVKIDQTRSHAAIRRPSDRLAAVLAATVLRLIFLPARCTPARIAISRWRAGRATLRLSD